VGRHRALETAIGEGALHLPAGRADAPMRARRGAIARCRSLARLASAVIARPAAENEVRNFPIRPSSCHYLEAGGDYSGRENGGARWCGL
jgi:hypothetical protein